MTIDYAKKHLIGTVYKAEYEETPEERFKRKLVELSRAKHGLAEDGSKIKQPEPELELEKGESPEEVMPQQGMTDLTAQGMEGEQVPVAAEASPVEAQTSEVQPNQPLTEEIQSQNAADEINANAPEVIESASGLTDAEHLSNENGNPIELVSETENTEEQEVKPSFSEEDLVHPAGLQPVGGNLVTRDSAPLTVAKELSLFMHRLEEIPEEKVEIIQEPEVEEIVSEEMPEEVPQEPVVEEEVPEEVQAVEDEEEIEEVDDMGLGKYAEPEEEEEEEPVEEEVDIIDTLEEDELPAPLFKPKRPVYQNDLQFARELALAEPKLVAKTVKEWLNPNK